MSFAVFGAGCFWCVEAIFSQLPGVNNVEAGYSNGNTNNPSYKSVCSGTTGYAEVCKISFNSSIISYKDLLKVFFEFHNPTTLNKQDQDYGTQYRSAIFYVDNNQKRIAEDFVQFLFENNIFSNTIVTKIEKLNNYYKAEDYHQDYYNKNPNAPYCKLVIKPKLDKISNYK